MAQRGSSQPTKGATLPDIRPATPADLTALAEMIHLLAAHHGDTAKTTPDSLQRDLFGPMPVTSVLLAFGPSGPVGYAALTRGVQLQSASRTMDMHHLFVKNGFRGKGLGQALTKASCDLARIEGCAYITVSAAPSNTLAKAFYPSMGFAPYTSDAARFCRMLTETA